MSWILMFALWGYSNPQPALATVTFGTKEMCIAAGRAAAESLILSKNDQKARWVCVESKQ